MIKVFPQYVTNTTQLETNLGAESSVICVINPSLVAPLKEEVKNDESFFKKAKKKRKLGVWGAIGMAAGSIALDLVTGGIAGSIVFAVGIIGGAVTAGSGTLDALTGLAKSKLKRYIWQDTDVEGILVLVKVKGRNTFDPLKEEIDFSGLEAAVKNATDSLESDTINLALAVFDVTHESYHIVVTEDKYRRHLYINGRECDCQERRKVPSLSYTIDGNIVQLIQKEITVQQLLFNDTVIAYGDCI